MSENSPRLDLPYIQPAQAQKHVTVNEALQTLDMLVQLSVVAFDETTPPSLPQAGDVHALGTGATGAWAGQDGALATYADGAWLFRTPLPGWLAVAAGTTDLRVWSGSDWQALLDGTLENLPGLGVNTTSDAGNRLAVSSPATLLTHEGAGHQLKINKAGVADTASLLFQDGWSGRAEMGLAGDDDFHVKVSADGASWTEALTVAAATGAVTMGRAAMAAGTLAAMTGTLGASAVAIALYDTGQDSDGGAWRARCARTAWYDEALDTATRGSRREMPARVLVVAEAERVTLHDADDPALAMWRVIALAGQTVSSVAMRNGRLAIGTAAGLIVQDYPRGELPVAPTYTVATSPAIANAAVTAVAVRALPGTPVDPVTGLAASVIDVGTGAGASRILADGTVVDSAKTAAVVALDHDARGALIVAYEDGEVVTAEDAQITADGWTGTVLSASSTPALLGSVTALAGSARGSSEGLSLLVGADRMVAWTTTGWTSGWMPGDARGAWLAATDASALVGDGSLEDADRSARDTGLVVHGTIVRSPVASGAELVACSGFSASNYLLQPYNAALDFGIGDFCLMGWAATSVTPNATAISRYDPAQAQASWRLMHDSDGFFFQINNSAVLDTSPPAPKNDGAFHHVAVVRAAGVLGLYVDGVLVDSAADATDLTNTAAQLCIGGRYVTDLTIPWTGSLALWRLSASAPSAAQIAKIHADERALFAPGALCTLGGATNAVTALAQDPDSGLTLVGTADGRSSFAGLERIDFDPTAVTTAILAAGGLNVEQ